MKCVDCHTSGSRASDPRIRGKEVHQFGKGDDPSGWVRNDLDNTVRSCESCHAEGTLGAPIARHSWLPPLHLDKIACATCHIPRRYTKAALVQASDVFNGAPRITPPPKRIWTFYDQDMKFWNHYGELDLFTANDKPVNEFRPSLAKYKGKIFPVDRVHSAWVGFEESGKPGLNQLFMKDFYGMWMAHKGDPSKYPQLAAIRDDNGDGMIEVNRPEEIDALLAATAAHLKATGFPLDGRKLVYVSDDRKYTSGSQFEQLPMEPHEASPYSSVYKYSHNVLPARAALARRGCIDCHSAESAFFEGRNLQRPFDETGKSVWLANYQIIGLPAAQVTLGALREGALKPASLFRALACLRLALWRSRCAPLWRASEWRTPPKPAKRAGGPPPSDCAHWPPPLRAAVALLHDLRPVHSRRQPLLDLGVHSWSRGAGRCAAGSWRDAKGDSSHAGDRYCLRRPHAAQPMVARLHDFRRRRISRSPPAHRPDRQDAAEPARIAWPRSVIRVL